MDLPLHCAFGLGESFWGWEVGRGWVPNTVATRASFMSHRALHLELVKHG